MPDATRALISSRSLTFHPSFLFLFLVAGETGGREVHQPHAALAQGLFQQRQRRRPRPTHLLMIRLLTEGVHHTTRHRTARVMHWSGREWVAEREGGCEPLEEEFSFGVYCAWWLDRCWARGGCYHRTTRLLALCSLRHPRMLGGARGRVWEREGSGRSLITACYLLLSSCTSN